MRKQPHLFFAVAALLGLTLAAWISPAHAVTLNPTDQQAFKVNTNFFGPAGTQSLVPTLIVYDPTGFIEGNVSGTGNNGNYNNVIEFDFSGPFPGSSFLDAQLNFTPSFGGDFFQSFNVNGYDSITSTANNSSTFADTVAGGNIGSSSVGSLTNFVGPFSIDVSTFIGNALTGGATSVGFELSIMDNGVVPGDTHDDLITGVSLDVNFAAPPPILNVHQGTAIPATLLPDGSTLDFGFLLVDGAGANETLVVRNAETDPTSMMSGDFGGTTGPNFTPTTSAGYGPLAGGASTGRNYSVAVTGLGLITDSVTFTGDDPDDPGDPVQTVTINFEATGVAPLPQVNLPGTTLALGPARVGDPTGVSGNLEVENIGNGNLAGGPGGLFNLNGTWDPATGAGFGGGGGGFSLIDGGTDSVAYTFVPTALGPAAGSTAVNFDRNSTGNNVLNVVNIDLTGEGVGPIPDFSETPGSTINFGTIQYDISDPGASATSIQLDISNLFPTDFGNLTDLTVDHSLTGDGEFSVSLVSGDNIADAGGADLVELLLTFTPTATSNGSFSGTLDIFTDENAAFGNTIAGSGFQFSLAASAAAVPEPATIAVWSLLGMIGVAWYRRRRQQNTLAA